MGYEFKKEEDTKKCEYLKSVMELVCHLYGQRRMKSPLRICCCKYEL